jgi:putative endonuclease
MAEHNELGKKGEALAVDFLTQKGYDILSTNYRFKHLEIDIIAKNNSQIVFVEVKTRQTSFLAGPEETVTKSKQKLIIKAANQYIIENEIDEESRFDIISIILNNNTKSIEHLEDAFYPTR